MTTVNALLPFSGPIEIDPDKIVSVDYHWAGGSLGVRLDLGDQNFLTISHEETLSLRNAGISPAFGSPLPVGG